MSKLATITAAESGAGATGDHKPVMPKLGKIERKALKVLATSFDPDGFGYLRFSLISKRGHIPKKNVRRAVRALARKGLAEFSRGLFTEDGNLAGSGYCCTRAGYDLIETTKNLRSPVVTPPRNAEAIVP